MSKEVRLRKGLDINLFGEADKVYSTVKPTRRYVVRPTDFHSLTPKLNVKLDDKLKAGTVIFFDKYNEDIKFCSPVSGKVIDIVRGEKRRILEVVIDAEDQVVYKEFPTYSSENLSRKEIIAHMLSAGVWPFIRQRPYDIIANPKDNPKAIFISTFNSEPLSIDNDFALYGMDKLFQEGLNYINKLTKGKVHLNVDGHTNPSGLFHKMKGVQINKIYGPHPSGNVGVQIHHIDPINKGDIVWYLEPQDVVVIARLFQEGKYDVSRIVALSGPQVIKPRYYRMISGASVSNLLKDNLYDGDNRVISGNVLTGNKIKTDDTLGFYHTTITVIEEGREQEFLGWIMPGIRKFSASRTFFSWLFPKKKYLFNANMHGEERAYVVTGQYEKVLPMDIYPNHLIKAIMMEDIELMENLGIYEVAPQDFALCEFVCTSKIEVQSILRYGLDLIRKENS